MSQEPAPEVQGVPVTALNWQDPPANRWAFWHVGDLLPTYRVPRGDGQVRPLPPAEGQPDLLTVPVTRMDRTGGPPATSTVGDVLGDTFTDAYLVLQDGRLVTEWYGPLGAPERTHALMSVSKSVVGCVAAVLIDRGLLDPDAEITSYVPELAGSGYAGALVRHVYDMRSGVRFLEEYANPDSDIRRLDDWVGWQEPAEPGQGEPRGLYRFLAALIAELIWAPMGAEHDALLLHDGLGTAVHDGGLCATARDVARFGQMLLDGGLVRGGLGGVGSPGASRAPAGGARRVVPPQWLRRAWAVDSDTRAAFAASPAEWAFPGGWYRHQFWFRPGDYGDVLLGLGIHGQMLHVSRRTNTVCVKFSSWPQAQNPAYLEDTLRAFDAVGGFLAGRELKDPGRRRLAGVVSGLSRSGDTAPPRRPTVV